MSTSKQSYKELAIPHFKEVFDIIDRVLTGLGIPYYLIGVSAISLELLQNGWNLEFAVELLMELKKELIET